MPGGFVYSDHLCTDKIDCEIGEGLYVRVGIGQNEIQQYEKASSFVPKTDRDRKLLLNKNEILKLQQKSAEKGLTIVPLAAGFVGSLVKIEIGLCKGKKLYDKKQTLKEKDIQKSEQRQLFS